MSTWKAKFEKKQQDQKDAEMAKKVEVNDISFPSLSSESAWGNTGAGAGKPKEMPKKSFAEMAAEWKEAEENEKNHRAAMAESAQTELRERSELSGRGGFLFNFGGTHSRMEDTYYEDEYADDYVPPPTADTSDDWRVCERKVRRRTPKTMTERIMDSQMETTEETAFWQDPHQQDETVWGKY
jgi:hypothetical protein